MPFTKETYSRSYRRLKGSFWRGTLRPTERWLKLTTHLRPGRHQHLQEHIPRIPASMTYLLFQGKTMGYPWFPLIQDPCLLSSTTYHFKYFRLILQLLKLLVPPDPCLNLQHPKVLFNQDLCKWGIFLQLFLKVNISTKVNCTFEHDYLLHIQYLWTNKKTR